ncbi:alginate export family protein [Luteolibacter marinus]|uniref:alginate export family protein n=1 Tax=Luteolibacter marinus TaxID=2776705 RepID=UPI001865F7DA|nr:alginate export family protein [Luteolibacter marinus]
MKHHTISSLLAIAAATTVTRAGTPAPSPEIAAAEEAPWIKPTLDIRARFEYGDMDSPALRSSTAFTTRERVGLLTKEWYGFSAFVEGEFTQVIDDSYDGAPGALGNNVNPNDPSRTLIADPETNELNQAWLQWKGYDTVVKGGRQRIIFDNAAMIGNVGWRQNEQTFDGVFISNQSLECLTLSYAYANRANRIFGSDALGAARNFAGDMHMFNVNYSGIENTKLTGYAYLLDFDETAANGGYISGNTFGLIAETTLAGFALRGEAAYQTDADSTPARKDDSTYAHLNGSYTVCGQTIGLGWEYLDADFTTPLATVHAFNGFADVFINNRIGLANNPGLNDVYLSHSTGLPFWGLKFSQFLHLFGDNNTEFDYGWEYDAVLVKKFNESFTAIAKFAYYDADGPTAGKIANPAPFDTTRVTVELNYKF